MSIQARDEHLGKIRDAVTENSAMLPPKIQGLILIEGNLLSKECPLKDIARYGVLFRLRRLGFCRLEGSS